MSKIEIFIQLKPVIGMGLFRIFLHRAKVRDNKDDVETITDIESSGAVMNSLFIDSRIVGRPNTTTTTTTIYYCNQ